MDNFVIAKRKRSEDRSEETKSELIELTKSFYERNTLEVTKDLIGKVMRFTNVDGNEISVIINEAEAYSEEEASCHAFKGKSERNKAMFTDAGNIYIYRIYGMHT
jgi:DNA-3-methyladenine glycosylase